MTDRVPPSLQTAAAFAWRLLVIALAIAVVAIVLVRLQVVVMTVFVALLAATVLLPWVERIEHRGVPRPLAAILVFAAAVVTAVLVLLALVPFVIADLDSSGGIAEGLRGGVDRLREWLSEGPLELSESRVDSLFSRVEDEARSSGSRVIGGAFSGALLVAQLGAGLLFAAVLAFFFVNDGDSMWDWFVGLFPQEQRERVRMAGSQAWWVLGRYIRGTAIVAAIDGVLIGLAIYVIGVPFAVPLGLLTFVASFVPIVGSMAAGAVAVLVALGMEGPVAAGLVLAAIFVVQQTEGNILAPKLVGGSVNLHPVAALLAVSVGGILLGVSGALVAVPLVAVTHTVAKTLRTDKEGKASAEEPTGDDSESDDASEAPTGSS